MNLKIPCPVKIDGFHPDECYLCKGTGHTVIPAEFTDSPITEFKTINYNSLGGYDCSTFRDGFGRITRVEHIQEDADFAEKNRDNYLGEPGRDKNGSE